MPFGQLKSFLKILIGVPYENYKKDVLQPIAIRPFLPFSYYFLIKILILIRKASPDGAACFVIYKEKITKQVS